MLTAPGKGGARITALNRAAQRAGLGSGDLLSNARSKVLDLQVRDADPAADAAALHRLALWCLRYTPVVALWDELSGGDGLFLDITGCAHLFGGEEGLLTDLDRRLRAFGLAPRLAVADTAGAAWGMGHHGGRNIAIVAPGEEEQALCSLPLAALRLDAEASLLMRRLGLRRIGEVVRQPRAPFAARFPDGLLRRVDQALGRVPEPLVPVIEPPVYHAHAAFAEPILSQEHVLAAATRLLEDIVSRMECDAAGARLLRLVLFKVTSASLRHDAGMISLDLGLATPSREAAHIAQLIGLRLHRLASELETDFGFEAAAIHVLVAEPLTERQDRLAIASAGRSHATSTSPKELARLIDRLQHRLGRGAVRQLRPQQSHIPERAVRARPAKVESERRRPPSPRASPTSPPIASARGGRDERQRQTPAPVPAAAPHLVLEARIAHDPLPMPEEPWGEGKAARPLLLLEHPEPAEVLAVVPDGPPRQFRWRGVLHQVGEAQGPERIAPEWWRRTTDRARDYFMVEDTDGRRFWLYRAGLYGEDAAAPQWYVHGVFA